MRLIPLTQSKFAQVDDQHFDESNQDKWHYSEGYARKNPYRFVNGKRKQVHIPVHRVVAETPEGKFTDHKDGDGLNNQESNLRTSDHKQNAANMKKQPNKWYSTKPGRN